MNSVSPDMTSRTLGNWSLSRMLGEGGFGSVYEAEHTTIKGRKAAVKVLHPHLAFHKDIKRRFITEASIASQAEHEHIVQVFDGGVSEDGVCYVAMELLRGQSLATLIRQEKRLTAERTIKIALQITSALEAAHALGVVHRDLKPDNIFLCQRKTSADFVKVLDFGIAKLHTQESNTTSGAVLGTPLYMSPEQWQTVPDIDGRSDLYALGIILFQCITGSPPYDGPTSFAVMMAHMQGEIPNASKLAPVPSELNVLIQRLMAKDRNARPSSARKVSNALRQMIGLEPEPEEDVNPLGATPVAHTRPEAGLKSLSLRQHSGELAGKNRTRRWGILLIPMGMVASLIVWSTQKPASLGESTKSPMIGRPATSSPPQSIPTPANGLRVKSIGPSESAVVQADETPIPDMAGSTLSASQSAGPAPTVVPKMLNAGPTTRTLPVAKPSTRVVAPKAGLPTQAPPKIKAQDFYEVPLVR